MLVVNDSVAIEKAQDLVPNIRGAVVKWVLGQKLALYLFHEEGVRALIRERMHGAFH